MNVLAEKLKNAGADTVGARVTTLCVEALRLHPDNFLRAWAHVGSSFGYELLRIVSKDMGLPETSIAHRTRQAVAPERVERKQKMHAIVRSKFKNSAGIAWSDIGWHELSALTRDGKEATALLAAGPASVPNDGRTVGQVLGVKKVDDIVKAARA